jgi:SNF2 family DNA or RNA helicase
MGMPNSYYTSKDNLMDLVRKFILKRTKKEAGVELPKLNTHNIEVEWSNDKEKALAEEIHSMLNFSRVGKSHLDASMAALGGEFKILPLLVRARQSCIYPPLMKQNVEQLIEAGLIEDSEQIAEGLISSSKMDTVISTILERKDNKRAKLVFCHYRGEIDILKRELSRSGLNVETFDGRVNTNNRSEILTKVSDILILQIQTGCEGLNLQQFSEIYFVSPHWNPAVEDQAVARCHRIGQENEIDVFRFTMIGFDDELETRTLDEYAADVQYAKREVMTMID